jgi:hypothetical protein
MRPDPNSRDKLCFQFPVFLKTPRLKSPTVQSRYGDGPKRGYAVQAQPEFAVLAQPEYEVAAQQQCSCLIGSAAEKALKFIGKLPN